MQDGRASILDILALFSYNWRKWRCVSRFYLCQWTAHALKYHRADCLYVATYRLGGVIAAYKIVPDEIDEIKVCVLINHITRSL